MIQGVETVLAVGRRDVSRKAYKKRSKGQVWLTEQLAYLLKVLDFEEPL